jgi:hypothetical protein
LLLDAPSLDYLFLELSLEHLPVVNLAGQRDDGREQE